MVLSQLQLAYFILSSAFAYSLKKLQNYSLCESLIKSFEAPKSGKTTTTKYVNKSLKKHHIYIYWVCQDSWPLAPLVPKGNTKFEILLVKIFSLKQKTKSNTSSYYRKKSNFYSSRKQCMVPLDKGLQ